MQARAIRRRHRHDRASPRRTRRAAVRAFRGRQAPHLLLDRLHLGVAYDWLPVTEDHPLRPITDYGRNKVAADARVPGGLPPRGLPGHHHQALHHLRPALEPAAADRLGIGWVDRVRKGKPIVVCGDGRALHQWLYVDDAAPAFAFVLGRERCIGQTYNMMKHEFGTWADYHRTAMQRDRPRGRTGGRAAGDAWMAGLARTVAICRRDLRSPRLLQLGQTDARCSGVPAPRLAGRRHGPRSGSHGPGEAHPELRPRRLGGQSDRRPAVRGGGSRRRRSKENASMSRWPVSVSAVPHPLSSRQPPAVSAERIGSPKASAIPGGRWMQIGMTQLSAGAAGEALLQRAAHFGVQAVEPMVAGQCRTWVGSDQALRRFRARGRNWRRRADRRHGDFQLATPALVTPEQADRAADLIGRSLRFAAGAGASVLLVCTDFPSHGHTA